jgi:tetratricopeptide (TPR) repeat protein
VNGQHGNRLGIAIAIVAIGFAICAAADESSVDIDAALAEGSNLVASGHHEEAVPVLQRALALQRSQYGLFAVRQQDTLKLLATSLTALNRLPDAQELMIYRVRVAEKNYGEGDVRNVSAVCELGDWFAETGKTPEARMTFLMAFDIVKTQRSQHDLMVVEPLRGIARTYMRRQSYPESWLYPPTAPQCSAPGGGCPRSKRMDAEGRRIVMLRKLLPEGEDALKRALTLLESDAGAPVETRVETLIQLGDWYQIKGSRREALNYYGQAWQLIRTTPDLPRSTAKAFDVPLRVFYPTPQIVAYVPPAEAQEVQLHYVQVEFAVGADGSVSGARITDQDTSERYARDILDAVKASRFRPKFVAGQPVATTGVSYRETFRTGKPRTSI